MAHDEMTMRPSELRGVRDAMRTMPKLIQALNNGEVEKFVLMKRGRVVAVMLDIEDYSTMVEKAKQGVVDGSETGGNQEAFR